MPGSVGQMEKGKGKKEKGRRRNQGEDKDVKKGKKTKKNSKGSGEGRKRQRRKGWEQTLRRIDWWVEGRGRGSIHGQSSECGETPGNFSISQASQSHPAKQNGTVAAEEHHPQKEYM